MFLSWDQDIIMSLNRLLLECYVSRLKKINIASLRWCNSLTVKPRSDVRISSASITFFLMVYFNKKPSSPLSLGKIKRSEFAPSHWVQRFIDGNKHGLNPAHWVSINCCCCDVDLIVDTREEAIRDELQERDTREKEK